MSDSKQTNKNEVHSIISNITEIKKQEIDHSQLLENSITINNLIHKINRTPKETEMLNSLLNEKNNINLYLNLYTKNIENN